MAKGVNIGMTNTERFNVGIARTHWKDAKTVHSEDWMKMDSASRYMEGRTYEWKNEPTNDGGLLQESTEEA